LGDSSTKFEGGNSSKEEKTGKQGDGNSFSPNTISRERGKRDNGKDWGGKRRATVSKKKDNRTSVDQKNICKGKNPSLKVANTARCEQRPGMRRKSHAGAKKRGLSPVVRGILGVTHRSDETGKETRVLPSW